MRFKILIFVLSLAFLAGTFLAAYWFYDTIDQPERQAEQALARRVRQAATRPPPDPAASSYQKALAALQAGEIDSAHEQFTRLLQVYPSSPRIPEVRRMLGEINLDRLFSRSPGPGKRDYIVKPGDSLARIEKGSLTTIPFLIQLNQLSGLNLQPGDRLVYQPLEFEIEIDLARSILIVLRKEAAGLAPAFFKEYALTAVDLPPQFPKTLRTQIQEKPAILDGKKVLSSDAKYAFARKRLVTTIRPGRANLTIRPDSDRQESPPPPAPAAGSAPPAAAAHGVFLADGDLEELSTILRIGTPVVVHR